MSDIIKQGWILGVATIVAAVLGAFIGRPVLNQVDGTNDRMEQLEAQNSTLVSNNEDLRSQLTQVSERLERVEGLFLDSEDLVEEPTSPASRVTGASIEGWLFEEENINQLPVGAPLSSSVDMDQAFSIDRFRLLPDRGLMNDKPLTLKWAGFVNFGKRGEHLFISSLFVNDIQNGNGYGYNVYSKVRIGGQTVLEDSFTRTRDGSDPSVTRGSIVLNPGPHRVEVWLTASWVRYAAYMSQYNLDPTAVELEILFREPGSRVNQPLRPEDFRHSQPQ